MSSEIKDFHSRLDSCDTLAEIFELVKQVVKAFLNKHRGGLMLGLADLGLGRGNFVGAFHLFGSNLIVLNRTPLKTVLQAVDKKVFNAYCFHLLLHEYLHSLGYIQEVEVKRLTHELCRSALGEKHPATLMAKRGVTYYFPKVTYFTTQTKLPRDLQIELIKDFDRSSIGYIH